MVADFCHLVFSYSRDNNTTTRQHDNATMRQNYRDNAIARQHANAPMRQHDDARMQQHDKINTKNARIWYKNTIKCFLALSYYCRHFVALLPKIVVLSYSCILVQSHCRILVLSLYRVIAVILSHCRIIVLSYYCRENTRTRDGRYQPPYLHVHDHEITGQIFFHGLVLSIVYSTSTYTYILYTV